MLEILKMNVIQQVVMRQMLKLFGLKDLDVLKILIQTIASVTLKMDGLWAQTVHVSHNAMLPIHKQIMI